MSSRCRNETWRRWCLRRQTAEEKIVCVLLDLFSGHDQVEPVEEEELELERVQFR